MGSHKRQPLQTAVWNLPTSLSAFANAAQTDSDTGNKPKSASLTLLSVFKPLENVLLQAGLSSNQDVKQEKVQRQHHVAPTGRQASEFHQATGAFHQNQLSYEANIMTVPRAGVYVVALSLKPDMIYLMPIEKKYDENRGWLKKLASAIYLYDQNEKPATKNHFSVAALNRILGSEGFNLSTDSALWEDKLLGVLTAQPGQTPAKGAAPKIS